MTLSSDPALTCNRLTIDLAAYADNWRALNDKSGAAECAAVVKADAYGISIEKAVTTLTEAGCKTFFVATPEEGLAVRAADASATVYILNGLLPGVAKEYTAHTLRPVLNTIDEVMEWAGQGRVEPAALHVDTGMNRLGLREEDALTLGQNRDLLERVDLTLIMSHLACGDTPRALMNGCQLSSFVKIAETFPGVSRSLCNSAGIFHGSSFHLDMVRPGIALYGGAALNDHHATNPMKPVVKAEARILQIRDVKEHESVGYGAAEVVDGDRKIATIAAGYADGYLRRAGSTTKEKGASGFLHGKRVPLVGRVSMDLIAVDVTEVPNAKRGDFVELFGPNIPLSDVAGHAQTIDYEYLTGLGKRYHRIYRSLGGANG
ncbi:MAG: alanine racemase [Pseudomonadota bacterium]